MHMMSRRGCGRARRALDLPIRTYSLRSRDKGKIDSDQAVNMAGAFKSRDDPEYLKFREGSNVRIQCS